MELSRNILLSASLFACILATDVDFIDPETNGDGESGLKCDACTIIAQKFSEAFSDLKSEMTASSESLLDEDIINAAEGVCDDAWQGYGVTIVNGQDKLTLLQGEAQSPDRMHDEDVWSRRLQDMCDELLGETSDEKTLYNKWANGNSMEDYLCRGEATFAACSSDDWGPWPGDDYDDYDDPAYFEGIHDEF